MRLPQYTSRGTCPICYQDVLRLVFQLQVDCFRFFNINDFTLKWHGLAYSRVLELVDLFQAGGSCLECKWSCWHRTSLGSWLALFSNSVYLPLSISNYNSKICISNLFHCITQSMRCSVVAPESSQPPCVEHRKTSSKHTSPHRKSFPWSN